MSKNWLSPGSTNGGSRFSKGQLVEIYIEREKEFALSAAFTRKSHPRASRHAVRFRDIRSRRDAFLMSATFSKTWKTTTRCIPTSIRKALPALPAAIGTP